MNRHFIAFVDLGKKLAAQCGLNWSITLDATGVAVDQIGWDMTALVGDIPPTHRLRDFSPDRKTTDALTAMGMQDAYLSKLDAILSVAWQDLIKALVLEQLVVKRNSVRHVAINIVRPVRVVGTCAAGKEPWAITVDDIALAIRAANASQASGKLGDVIAGLTRTAFDAKHLTDIGPLYPALSSTRLQPRASRRSKYLSSERDLRTDLEGRKRAERLPERQAFWELVRIVMTEKPATFMDELRFSAIRTMIVTGFRIGETALLPAEWRTERHYYDPKGRSAGDLGGYSKSLMIRHFAEKQHAGNADSVVLAERTHYVPPIFVEIISDSLSRAASITQPLRSTLRSQVETGRPLPRFDPNALVPTTQLYTFLTGNALWLEMSNGLKQEWIQKCRRSYSIECFDELQRFQEHQASNQYGTMGQTARMYFRRLTQLNADPAISLVLRNADGRATTIKQDMSRVFIRVGELESYLSKAVASKRSDTQAPKLLQRALSPWDFLYLHPKRSLAEERDGGICDISRYVAVGRPDNVLISAALGEAKHGESLFSRYGQTEQDKRLALTSHTLRHLQNSELFRLGIADTIISKRFNRRSVVQSYEYDHRSLAEELDQLELPVEVEMALGEKASTVAKMIQSGKANGPIVSAFKQIQKTEGDEAAFEFLKAEADGFHATPYGHCLNSFTVDPCPKHLECFSGCRHLSATNLEENRGHLRTLELKLKTAVEMAEAKPSSSIGRTNQIEHARTRLQGVRTLLAAEEGDMPFPDGPDLSIPRRTGVMDG